MEYGVNVSNKFAFLEGDDDVTDPEDVLVKAEQESKEKAKVKDVKKPVAPPVVQEKKVTIAPPSANKENVDMRRNQPNRRGGPGGFKSGPRGPRRPQTGDENAPPAGGDAMADRFGENRPPRYQNRGNFERRGNKDGEGNRNSFGRGNNQGWQKKEDRPPRHPRNENAGGDGNVVSDSDGQQVNRPPRGERPFRRGGPRNNGPPRGDRMSGSDKTGVRAIPKKDGFGKGNWGTEQDELAGETEPNAETDLNKTTEVDAAQVDATQDNSGNENAESQLNGEQEAEKIRELTLEEWKSQQKQAQPQFKTRKAGEGGDQKIYQKLVPINKQKVDKDQTTEDEDDSSQVKREPRERPLNIEVSFADSQRNRGGYRDREDRGPRSNNFERGGERRSGGGYQGGQGGRGGGFAGGRRSYNNADGPSGSGQRRQQSNQAGFNLTAESFPALGAR